MCVCVCSALISVTINRKWDEFLVPETSTLCEKSYEREMQTRGHKRPRGLFFFYLKRLKKKEKFSNPKLVFFIIFFYYFSVFSLFLSLGVNSFLPPPSFFWNWKRYHEALGPGTAVPSSRGHWGKRGGETVFPALTLLFRCLITAFLCSRLSPSSSSLLVSSSVLLCSSWKVKRQE